MAMTGNGTSIVFGTSGWTGSIISISGTSQSREALEDTHLGITGERTFVPDDLISPGEFDIEFYWDQSAGTFPPITAVAETITISFKLKPSETVQATLAGSGFATESEGPTTTNSELMTGTMTIQWDGKTGPTYTAGS